MKRFLKFAVLALAFAFGAQAYAQGVTGTGTGTGTATAQVGSSGAALDFAPVTNNGGVSVAAASAIAPGLVAGFKTCFGSFSNGFQIKDFGWATGKTYTDDDCQASEFGTTLWNQGFRAAAIGVLCSRPLIRYAFATTGGIPYTRDDGVIVHRKCPMTQDEWHAAGEPLLNPLTGQTYSEAELNPPLKTVFVPTTPEQVKQAADVAAIEHHAAELTKGDAVATPAPAVVKKPVHKVQPKQAALPVAPATVATN
jgi:hypothetical protein